MYVFTLMNIFEALATSIAVGAAARQHGKRRNAKRETLILPQQGRGQVSHHIQSQSKLHGAIQIPRVLNTARAQSQSAFEICGVMGTVWLRSAH